MKYEIQWQKQTFRDCLKVFDPKLCHDLIVPKFPPELMRRVSVGAKRSANRATGPEKALQVFLRIAL